MNNLAYYVDIEFEDLNKNQLYDVIVDYCDKNKYYDVEELFLECTSKEEMIKLFEANYFSEYVLQKHFEDWTK